LAQKSQYSTTPVPILKQINRHNEDGSYSYGYEAADGSFKIETKSANGEVKGKYGYVDDSGNKREIEYGANANGFQPSGDGINVAPAALHNAVNNYPALGPDEIDDGQYREDPAIYNDPRYNSKPSKSTQFRVNQPAYKQPAYKPVQQQQTYQQQSYQQPAYEEPQTQRPYFQSRFSAPATPAPVQSNYYQPQQQQQPQQNFYRSQQQPSNNYYQQQQQPDQHNIFQGHPASNLDLSTGSYSVTYG
jgi:hypothetical protein